MLSRSILKLFLNVSFHYSEKDHCCRDFLSVCLKISTKADTVIVAVRCFSLFTSVNTAQVWTSIFDLAGKPHWPYLPRLSDSTAHADLCACSQRPITADKQLRLPHKAQSTTRSPCRLSLISTLLDGGSSKAERSGGGRYCSICERVCLAPSLVEAYWVSQDPSNSLTTGYGRRFTWDSQTNGRTLHWPLKHVIYRVRYIQKSMYYLDL